MQQTNISTFSLIMKSENWKMCLKCVHTWDKDHSHNSGLIKAISLYKKNGSPKGGGHFEITWTAEYNQHVPLRHHSHIAPKNTSHFTRPSLLHASAAPISLNRETSYSPKCVLNFLFEIINEIWLRHLISLIKFVFVITSFLIL